ncbi:hypothetical protein [Actinoplanes sp. NPDC049265]|uniref:hypothetical protein n=1 Tax=Actinoplanes sp. NPDC049265 TaxID=3363902 RepID=UPI0037177282
MLRTLWRRLPRYTVDMLAWSVFIPGAVSGELMEYWLRRQPGHSDAERPLSRAERREWAALVERINSPDRSW